MVAMQRGFRILQCTPKWKHQLLKVPFRSFVSAPDQSGRRSGVIDGTTFEDSFKAERPYIFSDPDASPTYLLPAFHKWFQREEESTSFSTYIDSFQQSVFPYELIKPFFQGSETISRFYDSSSSVCCCLRSLPRSPILSALCTFETSRQSARVQRSPEDKSRSARAALHCPVSIIRSSKPFTG
jgi:hypothetical protein